MKTLRLSFACLLVCLMTGVAAAQYSVPSMGNDLSISVDPPNPTPNQTVTLSLQSAVIDLSNASITWSQDGKTIADGVGVRSVQVPTGALGSASDITASVSGKTSADASIALAPQQIDLIFDAATYVPPFYRGRSLPSAGSTLRLQAIPHIVTASGNALAASDLIYTWKQDGQVLGSISGLGKSTAVIAGPQLFGATTVSVDARSQSGTYSASASVSIPAATPMLQLYLDHPLFGIEYWNTLQNGNNASDVETSFAAAPYFVSFPSAGDPRLAYAWSINGKPVAASSTATNEITINAKGVNGPATISLNLTSTANFALDASGAWTLVFGGVSGASASPSPSSPSDAFHATQ